MQNGYKCVTSANHMGQTSGNKKLTKCTYMATSWSTSSDESNGAPTDFNVSSSLESSNGRSSVVTERCPVCAQYRRVYFCPECIQKGDFTHSKAKYLERFAEKKLRYIQLERQKTELAKSIEQRISGTLKKSARLQEIKDGTEHLELLGCALREAKMQKARAQEQLDDLRTECHEKRTFLERFVARQEKRRLQVEKLKNCAADKRVSLNERKQRLKEEVRRNLRDLTQYIFPIKEHSPHSSTTAKTYMELQQETEDPLSNALQEAQQTTYVRGHWVTLAAPPPGATYSIVEPRLPAHGDYSQYCSWLVQQQECASPPSDNPRNVGYTLSAGLMFTTQLVSVLSFYLDVGLPHHLCYREFGNGEPSDEAFKHRVAKLNANVIHLCASQGVDPLHLRPRATLRNLLLLLDPETADLGRLEAFELSPELTMSVEENLSRDLTLSGNDSDSNSDDAIGEDWESISNFVTGSPEFPRAAFSTTTVMSRQMSQNQPPPPSLFSSAAALVTNFWRTGPK
ncbi:beclin 1-associated autophagy-related key regulator-like [Ornithodoros turicata]|uniref:beclin 1-associated autophagy-related key regulator-like n=1 Tax=Ornithodoros turicata TaxID=34597 RepID=UPI003138E024